MCEKLQASGTPRSRSLHRSYLELSYRITAVFVLKGGEETSVFPMLSIEFSVPVFKPC